MKKDDQAYFRLRRHLDRQAVGFPATGSGAEIRILKQIFTPIEAEIAACLSFRMETLETIFPRASAIVPTREELETHLERIMEKGGIGVKVAGGEKHYCNLPLVVGIYEMQLGRLTPEFLRDFREYTSDRKFGLGFLSTGLPQMRTIPVSRSIRAEHNVSTFDEVTELVRSAEGPFVIMPCICRDKAAMEGHPCRVTSRRETCLGIGGLGQTVLLSGKGKEISREEALDILAENEKEGLVFQPSNSGRAEFICSCCGCCCGMLGIQKYLPRPLDFWSANYYAQVARAACNGCGTCLDRCQVDAVSLEGMPERATVDLNRCIGCGLCVTTCQREAIQLRKKPVEVKPPETWEELYEIIFSRKKGPMGKLSLAVKMIVDTVRTSDRRRAKAR